MQLLSMVPLGLLLFTATMLDSSAASFSRIVLPATVVLDKCVVIPRGGTSDPGDDQDPVQVLAVAQEPATETSPLDDSPQQQQQQQENTDETEVTTMIQSSTELEQEEQDSTTTTTTSSDEDEPLPQQRMDLEEVAREQALELRQQGKALHDEGQLEEASRTFRKASLVLQPFIQESTVFLEDYATCRLHEALCLLKQHDYDTCQETCTNVLTVATTDTTPFAAIRARAFHRRAKAKLGLHDTEGALQDARSAAFLGDRKAVALYGNLMRQHDTSNTLLQSTDGGLSSSSSSSPALLNDLLQGRNPFLNPSNNNDSSSSAAAALMESLLNKSSNNSRSNNAMGGAGADSALGAMLLNSLGGGKKGKGGGGGLAKSVLSSLSKRLENEATQDTICQYLQNTNAGQVQQLAAMAGMPLSQGHASRLVSFCHGITPRSIQRSVKTTKRIWYAISLGRKTMQIIAKYRHILILWVLVVWIKSAIQRPIPINKGTARLAMKQAMKKGIL